MNHNEKHLEDRKKSNRRQVFRLAVIPSLLAAVIGYSGSALAVQGGVVAAGTGSISTNAGNTTISQQSDKMVVNWKNFDIAKNQSVTFNQPTASSAVLNRVTSSDPTQINGALTANGRVFVVNPSGVMFGKTAKVDVGSLVASTLDTDDKQFMEGGKLYGANGARALVLDGIGGNGVVSNEGDIHATETVALLGSQAINRGTIRAKDVTLGAADGMAMETAGSGFKVSVGRAARNALAANYGDISVRGGNVELSAAATGAVLATVVKNTGKLEATRAESGEGGSVILNSQQDGNISVGGRVTADGDISIVSEPLFKVPPYLDGTSGYSSYGMDNSHGITVASNATLNSSQGAVRIFTQSGDVLLNGRVNAGGYGLLDVYGNNITVNDLISGTNINLGGNHDVTINAPIKAANVLSVGAGWDGSGDLIQNANLSGDGVILGGRNIFQADGVKTTAKSLLSLIALPGGEGDGKIVAANLNGSQVYVTGGDVTLGGTVKGDYEVGVLANSLKTADINGGRILITADNAVTNGNIRGDSVDIVGGDFTLNGDVKAKNDVNVYAIGKQAECDVSTSCVYVTDGGTWGFSGGSITQNGKIVSDEGSVALHADGALTQTALAKTKAAFDVQLDSFTASVGDITAGREIAINFNPDAVRNTYGDAVAMPAVTTQVNGKLKAPVILVPEDTQNLAGNTVGYVATTPL
ncbi:filamentous hemagglutinin outer membrane protein [Caballeronia pedi]|uniref:Filamentous hemagglutinin outer membrane protein n=2 Tax=Caballeronia pedi TaxID=1777141 RepID=A0A158AGJ9_9BURK|nr:filamentous hemagglutinin outer membrane protein [Caballeronia pedi]